MFCSEHGTADYCPDCLADEKDKELLELQKELDDLKASIPKIKADAVREALDVWRNCSDVNLRVNLKHYANQLEQADTE